MSVRRWVVLSCGLLILRVGLPGQAADPFSRSSPVQEYPYQAAVAAT